MVRCSVRNYESYPTESLLGSNALQGSDEKNTRYQTPLSDREQVEKQSSVTAPCCALKNSSHNLVFFQVGGPTFSCFLGVSGYSLCCRQVFGEIKTAPGAKNHLNK